MANNSEDRTDEHHGLSGDSRQMLEKHLAQFKSCEAVMSVAGRLFQKVPGLAGDMRQQVEWQCRAADTNNKTQRAWAAKKALVGTIAKAIRHGWMPHKVENYVSFLDLAGVVASCQSDASVVAAISTRTWWTFLLNEFDAAGLSQVPLHRLRRRLKQFLPESNLSSVQIDLEEGQDSQGGSNGRVFFRVSTVAKSKAKGKKRDEDRIDEIRLLKKDATFVVFYPEEPYFYCDKREPDSVILEAVCSCLSSSGCTPLALSGPHLESLRSMRMRRDRKRRGTAQGIDNQGNQQQVEESEGDTEALERDFDEADLFQTFRVKDTAGEDIKQSAKRPKEATPYLDRVTVARKAAFQGEEILNSYHEGRLPTVVTDLDLRVTFKSRDVLDALRDLSDEGVLATSTRWAEEVADRGRNVIKLRKMAKEEEAPTAEAGRHEDEDRFSVAESDVTMLLR